VLLATIWIALALFVLAEAGKGPLAEGERPASWARLAWTLGALLLVVHAFIAFATRYEWDHERAVRETALQGAAFYGVAWRGSIYVNYAFIVLWLAFAWRWRNWWWRAFALLMIVNGAIVFARPIARPFGILLIAALLWAWLPRRPGPSDRKGPANDWPWLKAPRQW
jgi:hypothetical protein